MKIEVCANSFRSALAAMKGGAHRIELCQNLEQGGTTPSAGDILLSVEQLHAADRKVFVLIRPRTGDFIYTEEEVEVMKRDIQFCKDRGADGVVIGALNQDLEIDIPAIQLLVNLAHPMELTFHRAFDLVKDAETALEQIIDLGFHRILTSGQEATAIQGGQMIKKLLEKARDRIIILPGSGINSGNILDLKKETGAAEFHLSAKKVVKGGKEEGKKITDENYWMTDWREVEKVVKLVTGD